MKKINDKLEDSWGSLDDGGASDLTSPEESKKPEGSKRQNQDLEDELSDLVEGSKALINQSKSRATSDLEEEAILEEVLNDATNDPIFTGEMDINEDPYNIIEKELNTVRTTSGKSAVETKRKSPSIFSEKRQASAPSTSPNKNVLSKPSKSTV